MSCGVYSFTGASISDDVKTVTIQPFVSEEASAPPTLNNLLTESLRDKFVSETNLDFTNTDGDLFFSGAVTKYLLKPIAITADETAAQNRLEITIKVEFINKLDEEYNFINSFSRFADYSSSQELSAVEDQLLEQITEELIEDIYNKSIVNW
jgi:hypothetical protein